MKKGVSPAIATVLLISIALVLAVIIFLWARNFIGEKVEKEGRVIDSSCSKVNFIAEVASGRDSLWIENRGNVPLHGVEIKKIKGGDREYEGEFQSDIGNGQTAEINIASVDISSGEIFVTPILLGETSTNLVPHVCDDNYGKKVFVA